MPRLAHLQPDSNFIYMQAESKQNIDFIGASRDFHLCNKIACATNIQSFISCLMEIGLFKWE